MCGIAGILHPAAATLVPALERMLERIRHRGRDDGGIWRDDGCLLGHNRLSIIDLSDTGHQPMGNEDGSIQVVLNGEIYNYLELREELRQLGHVLRGASDTEVIPHLYEEYGDGFVERLRGMFAIALRDTRTGRLVLARDRAGKKPLFYAKIDGGLAFASEMKALFAVPGVDLDVSEQAVHDFLTYGVVPGEQTAYRGIARVSPGHLVTVEAGGAIATRCYWRPDFENKIEIGPAEAVDGIERHLREAIRLRLRSDVPVGCFLSGGIDSGLVCALAARELDGPLRTFSVGFADQEFDERPLARMVAQRYGTEHHEFVLDLDLAELDAVMGHYDEPYADSSALPSFAVSRRAAEEVRVVLNGDGGDEIFAGYRHFVAARSAAELDGLLPRAARKSLGVLARLLPAPRAGRTPYQFLHRFLRVASLDPAARFVALTSDRLGESEKAVLYGGGAKFRPSLRWVDMLNISTDRLGPVDSMLYRDFNRLLGDDHLVKMDMASMAATLEARSPFLDHELIAFAASLPETVKLHGRTTKPLLRALAMRYLPEEVVNAPKRGFEIPLTRWMSEDLNGMLRERVLAGNSYAAAHFDRTAVTAVLSGRGWDRKRWAACAWTLLCLEIWWDRYRDTIAPAARGTARASAA